MAITILRKNKIFHAIFVSLLLFITTYVYVSSILPKYYSKAMLMEGIFNSIIFAFIYIILSTLFFKRIVEKLSIKIVLLLYLLLLYAIIHSFIWALRNELLGGSTWSHYELTLHFIIKQSQTLLLILVSVLIYILFIIRIKSTKNNLDKNNKIRM